jgi:hypothetical protein
LGITTLAANRKIIETKNKLVESIVKAGIKIYAFGLNFDKGKDEKYVICNERQYFYGIYADKWDFNAALNCNE